MQSKQVLNSFTYTFYEWCEMEKSRGSFPVPLLMFFETQYKKSI